MAYQNFQSQKFQPNKSFSTDGKVIPEKYANQIFHEAFNAPFLALQQGVEGRVDMNPTWAIVSMAAYMQEQVCVAWGKIKDEDLDEGSEYRSVLRVEEERLQGLVAGGSLSPEHADARLAYFKLAVILKKILATKGVSEELEV